MHETGDALFQIAWWIAALSNPQCFYSPTSEIVLSDIDRLTEIETLKEMMGELLEC